MDNVLVINSSASGNASVSRGLVEFAVERILALKPGATITCRDVGTDLIPQFTADTIAGVRGVASTAAELATQALSDLLIAEIRAADLIVLGAPMYNFSISSSLRTWFDHILRPRVTFAYGASGPEGLITGKRAVVIETRGGIYSEGPSKAYDFQEPYLKQLLGFVGITNVTYIRAEGLGLGVEAREEAVVKAKSHIENAIDIFTESTSKSKHTLSF